MYTVGVRDYILVAHSLAGAVFGPAQRLHGATYTVSVELEHEELSPDDIVIDIGVLRDELRHVLSTLDYQNLDEHPAFREKRSTTELVARHIHRELGRHLPITRGGTLTVTLDESPVAWARYRAPLRGATIAPDEEGSHPPRVRHE
jgi:6-pyruvoyl-tetrahydropterin synthase